jgi:phosphonate transport system substrate-binding protein
MTEQQAANFECQRERIEPLPPTAMLSSLPPELIAAVRTAFLEAATKDKAAFDRLSDSKNQPWQPIDNAAYDETIRLIQFVDRLRKKSS